MQNHNDGETPNNDTPEPGDPALQGNNGSESGEIKPTADENQQPEKDKTKRRTFAERLANAQKRKQKADEDERKLLKSLAEDAKKETTKFKSVLGNAAISFIKTCGTYETAMKLIRLLRSEVVKENNSEATKFFDRLAIEHLALRKKDDDANGDTPPQA